VSNSKCPQGRDKEGLTTVLSTLLDIQHSVRGQLILTLALDKCNNPDCSTRCKATQKPRRIKIHNHKQRIPTLKKKKRSSSRSLQLTVLFKPSLLSFLCD
jgi:hypothetical protein